MGKNLLKEIKKDPPKNNKRSMGALSDSITLKFMNLLQKEKEPKTEGKVQENALEYAKSILEGKEIMTEIVKDKDTKDKIILLNEWKEIEKEVNKKQIKKIEQKKHWSDILN
jgi:CxxC motif-containing protein